MALSGKLVCHVDLSSNMGAICNLFRYTPNEIAVIAPAKVHGCTVDDGERGAVGSVISWDYTHEGKRKNSKQIIEEADDVNHMIVFKVIGGDLVEELYKSFTIILDFDKNGDGVEVANWTFVFEKPDIIVPYPTSLMDYLCGLVKDLDAHCATLRTSATST